MSHHGQGLDSGRYTKGLSSNLAHIQSVPVIIGPTPFASKKESDVMSQSLQSLGKDSGIGKK